MRSSIRDRMGMLTSLTSRWQANALVVAVLAGAGCATAPPDDTAGFRQADARIQALEQFETLKKACRQSGGMLFVKPGGGRSDPTVVDLRMAQCTRRR